MICTAGPFTKLLEFHDENGPSGIGRHLLNNTGSQFGIKGFLVMLLGNRVPYRGRHHPMPAEWQLRNNYRAQFTATAQQRD